jgi:Putative beta-barrel porin 2
LRTINIAALIVVAWPIGAAVWSGKAQAAVDIVDARDTLDRAVAGPTLIGGVDDPTFDLFVADREQFDNNVFRLPSNADVATVVGPDASRQDHVNSPSAGLDGQWVLGRQIVDLVLRAQDNRYADNTNLNNVSTSDELAWNWGLGGVLTGQVGADYLRSLVPFVNATVYTRDTYQQTEYFATTRYQIGPRWSIYGGLLDADLTVDQAATRANDSRRKSVDMGVDLATGVADSFGLDYRYTDARYPNGIVITDVAFDPDYREDRVRFLVKRLLSEKTTLDLNAGYLKREYGNGLIGSFSGPIWRGSLGWQPRDKINFIVSAWRELQAYLTDQSNYYRGTGASITPVWLPTEKITVTLLFSREDQTYIGSSTNELDQSARRDTVNAQQASISYAPTRSLTFDVSYRHEQRDSNQPLRAYNDGLASAGVKFMFW